MTRTVSKIDDGGTIFDFDSSSEGGDRELTIIVPEDAEIRYFVARSPGFRRAGVITTDAAELALVRWVEGAVFVEEGLEIGRNS